MSFRSFLILLVITNLAHGEPADPLKEYQDTYAEWESISMSGASPGAALNAFSKLRKAWEATPESKRSTIDYRYAQAAISTAGRVAQMGNYAEADLLLKEAGEVAKSRPIVLSRGKSKFYFENMASLHAKVWSQTKQDPLLSYPTSYEMGLLPTGFYALQESGEYESQSSLASEFELPNLAPKEKGGTLLVLDHEGKIVGCLPVALRAAQAEKETLRSRLAAIYKPQTPQTDRGLPLTRESPEGFFAPASR